ncbi:phosphodiester glycosidase family protein [Thiorhodococcus fuscus]|uniref:Phosphodiester glycosidase family protein n=1 Tax=Thiorhodococcus fuscus TaxID=527200 RepID=A0ABW4Y429_9GAMM
MAGHWRSAEAFDAATSVSDLSEVSRHLIRASDGDQIEAHLVLFTSRAFRLKVVDLGDRALAGAIDFADALRSAGCVAGVNGGFFHHDGRPLGLVIASGRRINRFETSRLLSGLVYGDARGIYLIRRSRFEDRPDINALLQSGPYLVEAGRAVRGLSDAASASRTFVATDWRGRWLLGAVRARITLAELGELLATPGLLTPWRVERALNLDGGSSTGFFFAGAADRAPVILRPRKAVRTLLGIAPR